MACLDIDLMHFLVVGGGKACICCEPNTTFLGKALTEIAVMDKSLLINVTSQIVFSASWKKLEKVSNVLNYFKDRSGGLKVMHSKNKHQK